MLESLLESGVSTNDVSNFIVKQSRQRRQKKNSKSMNKDDEAVVKLVMGNKLRDNRNMENAERKKKSRMRKNLEEELGKNSSALRNFVRKMKKLSREEKKTLRKKNDKKVLHLKKKKKKNTKMTPKVALPKGLTRYRKLRIFNVDEWKTEVLVGPVIVDDALFGDY